ncbi:carboxypeptidase regulatory-like domain-containing protein [Streptomyces sp. P17]|uniref:carboxypeptidase regulatory-like domain-containing protein n=1 Tax=Streptomyces sp. P17 TaxID=3074716 RepID=UPI0028F40495|nr:carboxypeptidase regulatory-like domain-containing protein [Streptomyces sp. P17]MDT9699262.1 carboxypeptidase regulatory-like domain-containing protein [Streptomyces sp. P17]
MHGHHRAAGHVTVRVLDTQGRPVPRAQLTLVDRGGRLLGQGEARADGSCELAVPGAAPYVLLGGATGHLPGTTHLKVTGGPEPDETVLLLREVLTARGTVVEETLYMPVPDALAVFMDDTGKVAGSGVAADDGSFEVAGLRPGRYTLLVLHQEFEHWLRPVCIGGNELVLADAVLTRRLLSCQGVVLDADGRPVADTPVTLTDGSGLALRERTDVDGRFVFPAVPQGLYALGVAGWAGMRRVLVTEDMGEVEVTLHDPTNTS